MGKFFYDTFGGQHSCLSIAGCASERIEIYRSGRATLNQGMLLPCLLGFIPLIAFDDTGGDDSMDREISFPWLCEVLGVRLDGGGLGGSLGAL